MEYDGNHLVNATDSVSSGPTWQGVFHFVDGEEAEAGEDEYEYDVNGNMTKDLNRNISLVQYNSLNLPKKITFANNMGDISYTYSSTGEKLSVGYLYGAGPIIGPILPSSASVGEGDTPQGIFSGQTPRDGGGLINMDDLYSISYCGNVVYDHGVVRLLTDEGYVTFSTDGTPTYHFYVRDHLGNVRVVFDEDWDTEQVTHYYPFGGIMAESSGQSVQPYKYNGKELDRMHGLDTYDYGARQYNPVTARWDRMDPLCEKYYNISPYAYCGGNPVNRIDPDGREIWIYYDDENGEQQSFQYSVGMDCPVSNSSAEAFVNNLNTMHKNDSGATVIDAIMNSPTKYGYEQLFTDNPRMKGYFDFDTNMTSIADINSTLTFAEETFHMYQDLNKQGGKTAVNEVEAKLFSAKMNCEINGWSNLSYLYYLYSNKDSSYDEHIYNLFKYGYDFISYCYAVWGFISAMGYENLGYTTGYIKDEPLIINFLPVNE